VTARCTSTPTAAAGSARSSSAGIRRPGARSGGRSAPTKTECKEKLDQLRDEKRRTGTVARRDVTVEQVIRDLLASSHRGWRSPVTVLAAGTIRVRHSLKAMPGPHGHLVLRLEALKIESSRRTLTLPRHADAAGHSSSTVTARCTGTGSPTQ
jgi:hypothetical protein